MKLPAVTLLETLVAMVVVAIALSIGIFFFLNYTSSGDHLNELRVRQWSEQWLEETREEGDWFDEAKTIGIFDFERHVSQLTEALAEVRILVKNDDKIIFQLTTIEPIDD